MSSDKVPALSVEIVARGAPAVDADVISSVLCASFLHVAPHGDGTWDVTVLLARSAEISSLHSRFFGDASDTDVMSFPSGDHISEGAGYLGDIAISIDVAISQAARHGHSVDLECAYLALHGLLHLMGYRDDDDESRAAMIAAQDELFESWEREWSSRL